MLTDHAIVLKAENIDHILRETPSTREALEELLQEQKERNEGTLYVVFYRLRSGIATWIVLTAAELQERYGLDDIRGRFENRFERVVA